MKTELTSNAFDCYFSRGQKARVALPSSKPCKLGLTYSFADIQSSHLDEGISVLMTTISIRDSDTSFPAYFSNSYYYALGPLNREPFSVSCVSIEEIFIQQQLEIISIRSIGLHVQLPHGRLLAKPFQQILRTHFSKVWRYVG